MNRKNFLRKKIDASGTEALSDSELLEFLLLHSGEEANTAELLLSELGSIRNIADASPELLMKIYGLDIGTASLLKMIPAICHEKSASRRSELLINSADKAKIYFRNVFAGFSSEHFSAAALSNSLWISDCYINSSGAVSELNTRCRDIVRFIVKSQKNSIIIAHNHPDSTAEPSQSDITATKKIINALRPLGIKLLDHIIIGTDAAVSLREVLPQISFDGVPEYKFSHQPNYYK